MKLSCLLLGSILAAVSAVPVSAAEDLRGRIESGAAAVEQKVIAWRRDIHAHPELANHETRTAEIGRASCRERVYVLV